MKKKEDEYKIKVPVYTSELLEKPTGMFGATVEQDMIAAMELKITDYEKQTKKVTGGKKNKLKLTEIEQVNHKRIDMGGIPALLLKVAAFTSNQTDITVKPSKTEALHLNAKDKVGSVHNYFILYPKITGIDELKKKYQWLILVYDEPNKNSEELIKVVKLVTGKILNVQIKHILAHQFIKQLQESKSTFSVKLSLKSISYDSNEVDIKQRDYCIKFKETISREYDFEKLPPKQLEKLIVDPKVGGLSWIKKTVAVTLGRREVKFSEERNELNTKIRELSEEIFNMSSDVSKEELNNNIYEESFIKAKLVPILENYLLNYVPE